jgi:hypothetical protein
VFKFKQLVIGMIIGALLFGCIPALGANGAKTISVLYNNIKITVDGKELKTNVEPFQYNGNTFVPIRVISEALGVNVNWNDKTKTIEIIKPNFIQLTPTIALIKDEAIFGDYFYLGEVKNGKRNGHGYQLYGGGILEYSGEWVDDKRVGRGVSTTLQDFFYKAGTTLVGNFTNDNINGPAVMIDANNNGYNVTLKDGELQSNDTQLNTRQKQDSGKINSISELKQYLQDNFSTLETIIGTTHFTFDIDENTTTIFPWDYWIKVRYEYAFFEGAMLSNKYTDKQKDTLRQQLKDHQEKLARAVISKMPDKKFYGGYYDSYYRYPNLKLDLQTTYYYSWTNYDEPEFTEKDKYSITKPSTFRWYNLIDDEL